MYNVLRGQIIASGMTNRQVAAHLNIRPTTLSQKLNGKSDFTLEEAGKIKAFLNVDMPLEQLFLLN